MRGWSEIDPSQLATGDSFRYRVSNADITVIQNVLSASLNN